ncbi:uncharacterized protein JCM6883_007168 [Sporobolomyces salmoneus]|uniref:uncharacterized protein n=1 Tax=Sporobolomyces salmoneus TaxID=183962 RepID=UPI00316CA8F0
MTSSNRRNKAQFDLDDDHDDDSEVEQLEQRLPRIIVDEAVSPSNRSSRRGSRDEEERHVGFAADPETGRDNGGWTSRHHEGEQELGQSRNSKEKHTYPPSSTTEEPSPTSSNSGTGASGKNTSSKKSWSKKLGGHSPSIPESLAWVPSKLNWKGLRPVLRSTIASWCGLVLILVHPSQVAMGRAGFLVLVVSVISSAALPIANQLEQTFFQFLLVSISWAWATLALAIAHAARSRYHWTQAEFSTLSAQPYLNQGYSAAEISDIVTKDLYRGKFLEPASSAVCGVFLGVACGFFLWLRDYLGPGPALFGCIFAIILQVISLTLGVLFPATGI